MVRSGGLEPPRVYTHYPLKVARLPFRHNRMCNYWCSGTELNRRHGDFQSPALPTELPEQNMATPIGFEPTIFAVTGRHVKPLHHGAVSYFFRTSRVPTKSILSCSCTFGKYFFYIFLQNILLFPIASAATRHTAHYAGGKGMQNELRQLLSTPEQLLPLHASADLKKYRFPQQSLLCKDCILMYNKVDTCIYIVFTLFTER